MTAVNAVEPVPSAASGHAGESFVHEGLFYHDQQAYAAGLLPFIRAGLAAEEPVLVAVPGAHLDQLRDAVGGEAGRVRFVDMAQSGRNPGRIIPAVLHAFIEEHSPARVRIIGEPIWPGRTAVEYPACVQHEALINAVFTGRNATILCPYDAGQLTPEVLADAARTHPVLVRGDDRRSNRDYTEPGAVVAAFNRPLPEPAVEAGQVVTSFAFEAGQLATVRHLVADRGRLVGMDPERITDLQMAVNEVAANTIEHTGRPGTLRIWRERQRLICEVHDSGRLTELLVGRIPPAPSSERGRGLVLVNYLCDLVRVHTQPTGTTIRMHMAI
jgi:anti-sigma regulatory factor (Ser/Thr protein kinase)